MLATTVLSARLLCCGLTTFPLVSTNSFRMAQRSHFYFPFIGGSRPQQFLLWFSTSLMSSALRNWNSPVRSSHHLSPFESVLGYLCQCGLGRSLRYHGYYSHWLCSSARPPRSSSKSPLLSLLICCAFHFVAGISFPSGTTRCSGFIPNVPCPSPGMSHFLVPLIKETMIWALGVLTASGVSLLPASLRAQS